MSENNLARFKDIKLIAVTGSVASGYPKKNDDIDLLVVTGNNRLWLTRFKVRIYVALNGVPHRKWNEKHEEDKFCFNLWLDEETIKIARDKRNLQNAVDLILMKPILNRDKTYEKMLLANDWVKKYVATGYDKKTKSLKSKSLKSKEKTNYIDKVINWLVFWPQYWYMKGKIKKETVDPKRAYFHPEG